MNCPACDHDNIPGQDLCENCGLDLAGLDVEAGGVDADDPLFGITLGEVALKEPLVLSVDATVAEAIDLMKARQEGCVFITDGGALAGVLTERDVGARVAVPGRDPARTSVRDVMTPNPVTLSRTDPLAWALHRMGVDGYRHIPVLDNEQLIGFLSSRTVLQILLDA